MRNTMLSLFFLLACGVLLQSAPVLAADEEPAETVIKVDKGDVVWSGGDGDTQQIYFSTYLSRKGAWSEPVKVTDDTLRNGHPVIDADKNGKRVLVWTTATGNDYIIRYSVGKGDTWSEPAAIPSQLQENLAPSVMVDKKGVTWVVWSANDGGQDEIYYSRFAEDSWSVPMRVNGVNEVPDILPVIALNDKGVPQVSWRGYRHDEYVQLQSTWDGEAWSEEMEIAAEPEATETDSETDGATETKTTAATKTTASVVNMPSFIERPEEAYLRVYKSSIAK